MADDDVLIHTFLNGDTMMLRIIWRGQVLECALSLAEITAITATIADWQRVTEAEVGRLARAERAAEQHARAQAIARQRGEESETDAGD